ncbi:MAG: hypothetical protein KDC05_03295, partial [Bacteroidales bacterium]|nr:hypothetical protein [Bacteroidales bacterium]
MKNKFNVFLVFMSVIMLGSCDKDRPEPSWNVDVLAPLLVDTIRITDVISDTLINTNPDYSVSFVFNKKLYEVNVDSLVKLPDTLFNFSFSLEYLPNPVTLQPGDTIIEEVFDWPLDFESFGIDGVKMDEGWIRSGNVIFEVFNQSETDLLASFGINSAVRNETDTFLVSEKVPDGGLIGETYDFSGYRLDLTGMDGDEFNLLNYYLALIVHPDEPSAISLNPTDSFSVNVYFEDVILDYGHGYFGRETYHFGPETYPFTFFDDLDLQGFGIEAADVNLVIGNTYGMESNLVIQEVTAINNTTGENVSLEGSLMNEELFVEKATEASPGSGIVDPFIAIFDFSDSNFPELISIMPDELTYSLTVETNVLEDSTDLSNFFYYEKPIGVYAEVDISQGVNIEDMFVENRVAWYGGNVELDKVQKGTLKLNFTNGFPFNFDVKMFLEDE